jgi:hypothetical protein
MTGYNRTSNGICEKNCPENSIDNGAGVCICREGFYRDATGICRQKSSCPANSIFQNGICVCVEGYEPYYNREEMYCAKCPDGQFWVENFKTCEIICAMNEIFNKTSQKCECKEGYGKYEDVCAVCPSGFFLKSGFCITCPRNSQYDEISNQCKCKSGYVQNVAGLC